MLIQNGNCGLKHVTFSLSSKRHAATRRARSMAVKHRLRG
jgi:hypothetical protein